MGNVPHKNLTAAQLSSLGKKGTLEERIREFEPTRENAPTIRKKLTAVFSKKRTSFPV